MASSRDATSSWSLCRSCRMPSAMPGISLIIESAFRFEGSARSTRSSFSSFPLLKNSGPVGPKLMRAFLHRPHSARIVVVVRACPCLTRHAREETLPAWSRSPTPAQDDATPWAKLVPRRLSIPRPRRDLGADRRRVAPAGPPGIAGQGGAARVLEDAMGRAARMAISSLTSIDGVPRCLSRTI